MSGGIFLFEHFFSVAQLLFSEPLPGVGQLVCERAGAGADGLRSVGGIVIDHLTNSDAWLIQGHGVSIGAGELAGEFGRWRA